MLLIPFKISCFKLKPQFKTEAEVWKMKVQSYGNVLYETFSFITINEELQNM